MHAYNIDYGLGLLKLILRKWHFGGLALETCDMEK